MTFVAADIQEASDKPLGSRAEPYRLAQDRKGKKGLSKIGQKENLDIKEIPFALSEQALAITAANPTRKRGETFLCKSISRK